MRLIEEACGRLFEKLQNYLTTASSGENENDRRRSSQASKRGTASSQAQSTGTGTGAGKGRARGRRAPRRSRALRKLLGPAPASDAEEEDGDEYGSGRLAARSQRSARSQAMTTSLASRKRQYVELLDYERSESSEGDTPSADTAESEDEEELEDEEETEEEDEIEYDDESSPSVIDVDDDDEGGPPPLLQPRPRRAVERSWQLTPASQASAAGASSPASASASASAPASASATASHPIISRIDRSQSPSQSQSGSSVGGVPRPVLQLSPASPLPSISYSQTAPLRTVVNANANPSRQQVSPSPPKQAASSRPALVVSQPQSQPAPSSRSSGYSILTIVPSSQRRTAPAPLLPALPATATATATSQSSALASESSSQVHQSQPRPLAASQSAHSAGIVRPASSFSSSQPSTQSRLVAPVPGSTPIVRLAHPALQRSSASAASSTPNLARGSIHQPIAQPATSRKRLADALDDDLTTHH